LNLSKNPNAIELLKENIEKINWHCISTNPNAISILKEHPDKISWHYLSGNPNAIELLKANKDKINWHIFSSNPSIITYDYEKMRNLNLDLKEEIIAKALHPKRIFRLIEEYGEELVYNIYLDD
jgi:hypothetical protein